MCFFFLKMLNEFLIFAVFCPFELFLITIQLQNKVIADKICFPVYDYIIGLQQV